jgi:hypothetical protein
LSNWGNYTCDAQQREEVAEFIRSFFEVWKNKDLTSLAVLLLVVLNTQLGYR